MHFARCLAQLHGVDLEQATLLLDEPVASLDLAHQHRLLETVSGLCEQGLTALVVLHDLVLAARYADEIWVLSMGRMKAQGPPRRVLTSELLAEVFGVEADLVSADDRRCHLHVHSVAML